MEQRKNRLISILSATTLVLVLGSCSNLDELTGSGDEAFSFSAHQSAVTVASRGASGEVTTSFDEGTKYYLYALEGDNWAKNYLSSMTPSSGSYLIGTETSGHEVALPNGSNNKFNHLTLNFYGITEQSKQAPTSTLKITESGNSAPTVYAEYPSTNNSQGLKVLPDYMWCSLKNQDYHNAGTLTLPFIHTTAMLNFLVETNPTDASLDLSITKIELCDYKSGVLNMTSGKFESSSATDLRQNNWYTIFSGNQKLTGKSAPLMANGVAVQPTIFPTRDKALDTHSLGMKITLSSGKVYIYWAEEPNLNDDNTVNTTTPRKAFQFDANYVYDVQLSLSSQAAVVTILPRKYGWISSPETQINTNELTEIGNPVTFGGVVWADRNLGATSADPTHSEMDWERARGWYYQFGRSIPYYVEGSMQDPKHVNDTKLVSFYNGSTTYNTTTNNVPFCDGDSRSINAKPFPFVAGHYNDAWSWYSAEYSVDKLAKSPSDSDDLKFNFVGSKDWGTRDWASDAEWKKDSKISSTYWNDKENQPCPKGWRLPTCKEFMTIYPSSKKAGDIAFNTETVNTYTTSNGKTYWTVTENTDVDKAIYLGIKNTGDELGTIYAIKNPKTNKAYRIMWSIKVVGDGIACINTPNNTSNDTHSRQRCVLVISRFPATINTTLSFDKFDIKDWQHPSEVLYLPLSGYVHRVGDGDARQNGIALIYAGCEGIYWTGEISGSSIGAAKSIRLKVFGNDQEKELFGWDGEHRCFGCQIRCVRDDSVKD